MNDKSFKAMLAAHGMTQEALAKEMNVAQSTIVRKRKNDGFTISDINNIARILSVPKSSIAHIFLG